MITFVYTFLSFILESNSIIYDNSYDLLFGINQQKGTKLRYLRNMIP